ncbi:MAG: acyloxyacyl hydrolase [Rhodospirillales bacterium]|nr:acyloxyacyl hydrolase [Rhodospirillales bacterium]
MRGRGCARRPRVGAAFGAMLAVAMGAIPAAGPARADHEGTEVEGMGEVVYHAGDLEAFGPGPDVITLGVGAFDGAKTDPISAEFRAEFRSGRKLTLLGPLAGVLATTDGGVSGYGGLYMDLEIGRVAITPAGGAGAYRKGSGKDLGGTFQFHLGLDVAYRFDGGSRLGLKVAHISNAFLHDSNPGEESFLLTYSLPVGRIF